MSWDGSWAGIFFGVNNNLQLGTFIFGLKKNLVNPFFEAGVFQECFKVCNKNSYNAP